MSRAGKLEEGMWVGDYQIESHHSSGGMAEIYRARRFSSGGFGEVIALKVIKEELSNDARFVKLFIDEARISARITHPNVVRVLGFGEANEGLFIAMPLVDGFSTSQILRAIRKAGTELPIELVAYIGIKVADALEAAHKTKDKTGEPLGILHCDVTPSNILVNRVGEIMLIDFGAAIARRWVREHGEAPPLRGKIRYMPPEQLRGVDVDERCDVYALGVVLWELLAATKAIDAANEDELLEKVIASSIPDVRQVRSDVGEELAGVISRATAADVYQRTLSAAELSSQLAHAIPAALLVDGDAFAPIFDLIPAAYEPDEPSWVSEIVMAYLADEPPSPLIELGS